MSGSRKGTKRSRREQEEDRHPRPAVTVDIVVFTVVDTDLKVLLVERGAEPYGGRWALPGGFVQVSRGSDQGEDLEAAAHRELCEETGLPRGSVYLEQLYTFGKPRRDPRTRVITVAHYALVRPDLVPLVRAGSDAAKARWVSVAQELGPLRLAFDHADILAMAVERIRGKVDYTPIAFELVGPTFTVAELREVHEAIKGTTYDPANFRRRFKRMQTDRIIEQAPGKRQTASKPAKVYRFVGRGAA
ncbi:MAG: NUDIX hydrolase [Deltaproteobacteria bacterium]|jgi:8-oxo-dGTP diphosphatase|nr:NUDIX hydrolase [Deltaproteobacteria bacterium]MBW2531287.1 NUDIX hydrolase [Deltaproteobacteria bacterium]